MDDKEVSQQQGDVSDVVSDATTTDTNKPLPKHVVLNKRVKELISASGSNVEDAVVQVLVSKETERRKTTVLTLLDKIAGKERDLEKAQRQGTVLYGADSKPLGTPSFTKQQIEDIKKLREEADKLIAALTQALEKNNWDKAFGLAGGNQQQGDPK